MKLSRAAIVALAAAAVATPADTAAKALACLHLPAPLNWLPGNSLYPDRVITGFSSPFDKYEPEAWADHVRDQCQALSECTVSVSYSGECFMTGPHNGDANWRSQATGSGAINNTEDPFWFGWAFNGGKATLDDFMRSPGVENSVAYSV